MITADPSLAVLEGVDLRGQVNTTDATILEHIRHSIRLGYPQVRPQPVQKDRVCLVGGGPSLESTFHELRDLYFSGAKVVTVNGAYQWCLERNIRPSAQVVLDARASNARFVSPVVPQCRYLIASQCHPDVWAALEGREDVWIWHAIGPDETTEGVLNAYYGKQWMSIGHGPIGGTTVGVRAIALLRTLGFFRFDLFGFDSCYLDGHGHAYPQPENDRDRAMPFRVHPTGHPEAARTFRCAPWHIKQLEDFVQAIRVKGDQFVLNVHGDGLLAYALTSSADLDLSLDAAASAAHHAKE